MYPDEMDYRPKQVRRMIECYQELRSTTELIAADYEQRSSEGSGQNGPEEILCMLIDLDQAIVLLTERQRQVVNLTKTGCSPVEISRKLGISPSTVKFHLDRAIFSITTCLNSL